MSRFVHRYLGEFFSTVFGCRLSVCQKLGHTRRRLSILSENPLIAKSTDRFYPSFGIDHKRRSSPVRGTNIQVESMRGHTGEVKSSMN